MADVLGDFRNELHRGRARADDADPLVGEIERLLGPLGSMERHAGETVASREVGDERGRQDADRRNQKPRLHGSAVVGLDPPAVRGLVVGRRDYPGIESNVPAQVELVRDVVQVPLGLRLAGKVLAPVPLLQEFVRKGIAVAVALGVEACPRIAVPIPRAADTAARLEHPDRQASRAQPVQLIESGDPGSDDDGVELPGGVIGRERPGGIRALCRSLHIYPLRFVSVVDGARIAYPARRDIRGCLSESQRRGNGCRCGTMRGHPSPSCLIRSDPDAGNLGKSLQP